ncbi:hypothetical protein NYE59_23770 [Paenibacillus sp. FSL L8-0323]|uniref:hypothetical protein n=1 Tax=Paenibacillus sp. FSL L8-0323 TaxID=2975330 RepID=UPI0030F4ED03
MKKIKIIMMFLLFFSAIPVSNAFAKIDYSGGLFDGKIIYISNSINQTIGGTLNLSDNNENTNDTISYPSTAFMTAVLTTPSSITGIRLKANNLIRISYIRLLGESNTILHELTSSSIDITGELITFPAVENVKKIIMLTSEGTGVVISEFNAYGTVSTPSPSPTITPEPTPTATATPVPTSTPSPTVSPTPTPTPPVTPKPTATPEQPSGDRAILTVTLINGSEKEYDLPMSEVEAFINWYDARDAGRGPGSYAIDKHSNNKGPFSKRKDYVVFDKILTFEVSEYTIE